jgi:MFS family permease
MQDSKAAVRAREQRWAVPVGIASIVGVILLIVSRPLSVNGDGSADYLREAHDHSGSVLLSGLMQVLAFLLLALPLLYLFRAVQARSDRVRPQLIGLMVAAPLFLAVSSGLAIGVNNEAADSFVAGDADSTLTAEEANEECVEERQDEGNDFLLDEYDPAQGETPLRACEDRKVEDDEASNALTEASLAPLATGLSLAGALGFAVALLYSGLWAMRTGVLSRFWGSLGMVAGVAVLLGPILLLVTLVFFVYFGLLALGIVPGGRPPAWAAGEAVPWPTPGEKAAGELEPEGGWGEGDLEADEVDEETGERRKRKQRE